MHGNIPRPDSSVFEIVFLGGKGVEEDRECPVLINLLCGVGGGGAPLLRFHHLVTQLLHLPLHSCTGAKGRESRRSEIVAEKKRAA